MFLFFQTKHIKAFDEGKSAASHPHPALVIHKYPSGSSKVQTAMCMRSCFCSLLKRLRVPSSLIPIRNNRLSILGFFPNWSFCLPVATASHLGSKSIGTCSSIGIRQSYSANGFCQAGIVGKRSISEGHQESFSASFSSSDSCTPP